MSRIGRGTLPLLLSVLLCPVGTGAVPVAETRDGVSGLVVWRGGHCEVADAPGLQSAFRAYLRVAPLSPSDAAACVEKRSAMVGFLGRSAAASSDLGHAWQLLRELSDTSLDPDALELFHVVMKTALLLNGDLRDRPKGEALRRREEILSWNLRIDRKKASEAEAAKGPPARGGHPRPSATPEEPPPGPAELELESIRAEIARMDLGQEVARLQARLELQDLALGFLRKGDPEAAILAVRWYRGIFSDSQAPLRLGPDAAAEVSEATEATLGDLEETAGRALEAIRGNLSSTTLLLSRNATAAASQSLSAAFAEGSRAPEVLAYPADGRKRILERLENEEELASLIEGKRYAEADKIWNGIAGAATDFDGRESLARIRSGMALSAFQLKEAMKAMGQGEGSAAIVALHAASEAWPGNPDIPSVQRCLEQSKVLEQKAASDFDGLHAKGDFSAILAMESRFRRAVRADRTRTARLEEDLPKGRRIAAAMDRARLFRNAGRTERAWETVCQAWEEFPGAEEVRRMESELRPAAGPEALEWGRIRGMERDSPGPALALALSMTQRYPESPLPGLLVRRLTELFLGPQGMSQDRPGADFR